MLLGDIFAGYFMVEKKRIHIALVGNPNIGKSSLFNCLTGLKQKVSNFPGVTVEKKTGITSISDDTDALVIDLPGTYSLYPRRDDEWVAYNVMMGADKALRPDLVILVADASNLKRNLLFTSQIIDLKIPVIVALSMMDIAKSKGVRIDVAELERELGVPVIPINPRKDKGIPQLKKAIEQTSRQLYQVPRKDFINNHALAPAAIDGIRDLFPQISQYKAIHYLINHEDLPFETAMQDKIEAVEAGAQFNKTRVQAEEIMQRYGRIKHIMQQSVVETDPLEKKMFTEKIDNLLLHRTWGYVILLVVLFLLFQSIFWLAQYPMDWIELGFAKLNAGVASILPQTWWSNLLLNGILAGLGGIVVFVPQIMILFGLITLLEDSGYMARISFLTDGLMRKVGLNGKSVMPMISGLACAVPAIMSARNIENRKERLLTIMITPLMSCSARLPVYTILIGLVIPRKVVGGIFGLQGLVMMGLYLLGLVMALIVAWVMKWMIKMKEKSFFILELPVYRAPRWKNMVSTMLIKARIFVTDAGKIIMIISLVLWLLSNFGPPGKLDAIENKYAIAQNQVVEHLGQLDRAMEQEKLAMPDSFSIIANKYDSLIKADSAQIKQLERQMHAEKLEHSFAGIMGKSIEPAIKPLGFDWKIGIALITSFAAREVFVGTMATLYSVEEDDKQGSLLLREKMRTAVKPDGTPVYDLASGLSLLVFYVLAMQCMSTLAVVKRETRSWKWPVIQLIYMTVLAYAMSALVYWLCRL
jgi:ferrous iron transport protein B